MDDAEADKNTCLSKLICGYDFEPENEIDVILEHLSSSIEKVVVEISKLPSMPDDKLIFYGPYLGRSLLELSMTALLARLDPFRILVVKGKQIQPGYELNKPHVSAIRWQGDVIDKAVADLWTDKALQNPSRAILGPYQVKLALVESAQRILDELEEGNEQEIGAWHTKLVQMDANGLVERIRTQINSLYSSLSKGIHHELLVPIGSMLDRNAMLSLLDNALFVISTLGLVISRVPHAYHKCPKSESFMYYKKTKELEVSKYEI
ncbi:MAG: hypothetical protein GY862_01460 [Gammaproteobacteria bacterium]|nr:hypothetical protein [Gammaproteobacteria bacterium]